MSSVPFVYERQTESGLWSSGAGPTCRVGAEGDRERKEREGKSLSNIINLHSQFAVARVGTTGCALLHHENVDEGGHQLGVAT